MIWKYLGVALYLIALLGIGVAASRKVKDVKDYFAAGKQLNFWAVAFSARATGESAWLLLGLTGMGATFGVRGFWVVLGEIIGVVGAWLFMAKRFNGLTDRYDAITVPDYLEGRFRDKSQTLRKFSALALVVFVTIYVSAQIDATGTAFESFLGVNYFVGALVGFMVVMAYSVTGGFLAVVWSDIFQGTLMFFGLVILPIVGIVSMGGWGELTAALATQDPTLLHFGGPDGWTGLTIASTLGLGLIGLGFLGSPQIFVRFLALRDTAEIPKGAAVAFVWTLCADSGAVLIGMIGRASLPGGTAALGNGGQDVLPLLVENLMPPVIIGLYIAIVLSAIMSTVDSLLVVAGSAAVRDYYQQVLHPDMPNDQLITVSRYATLGLGVLSFILAMSVAVMVEGRSVFWFVLFGWSGIAATFCPTIILSLYWKGFTRNGALGAMVSGFVCVPLFKFGAPLIGGIGPYLVALAELPPAFLISGLVGIGISLMDKPGQIALEGIEDELQVATDS